MIHRFIFALSLLIGCSSSESIELVDAGSTLFSPGQIDTRFANNGYLDSEDVIHSSALSSNDNSVHFLTFGPFLRLNSNHELDTTVTSQAGKGASLLFALPGGAWLVKRYQEGAKDKMGLNVPELRRFTSTLELDPDISSDLLTQFSPQMVSDVVIDQTGKILVAGSYNDKLTVMRFLPTGALDTQFGINGIASLETTTTRLASQLILDGDTIWVRCSDISATPCVAKLNANGSFDTSFGDLGLLVFQDMDSRTSRDLLIDDQGRVLILGGFENNSVQVVRFSKQGIIDQEFGESGLATFPFSLLIGESIGVVGFEQDQTGGLLVVAYGGKESLEASEYKQEILVFRFLPNGAVNQDFGLVPYTFNNDEDPELRVSRVRTLLRSGNRLFVGGTMRTNLLPDDTIDTRGKVLALTL